MANETHIGVEFANALARKDFTRIGELMQEDIDFRAMTPRRNWEASDPQTVVREILAKWFEDSDEIREMDSMESDSFADRERVGYRFRVHNPEGEFLVEQQAYLSERDGRISWMRVLCSGFRPIGSAQ